MTQYSSVFNPKEFELRDYTSPYLTPEQTSKVAEVETRVEGNLDFVAQMLGWSGPNYLSSLTSTPSEKRQLLGGTYGVYNSFIIAKIYEIRNWNDTIVVDRIQFLQPNQRTYVENVVLGEDVYKLQSVAVEGDKYVISMGVLPQSFYDQIEANVPLKIDIPSYRPSPFTRSEIGASGDGSFICSAIGTQLSLYPSWDTSKSFPYLFPILFAGSVYYFDQPVYLTVSGVTPVNVYPEYDINRNLWYLLIPENLSNNQVGLAGNLVWSYSNSLSQVDSSLTIKIQSWIDPSDWKSLNVLENFRGAWNNKGGSIPFNLAFDSLSIHGFDEQKSLYLDAIERSLPFNDLIGKIYSQTGYYSSLLPPSPNQGDLWWNPNNGILSVWIPNDTGCGFWVEVDYRQEPQKFVPTYVFPTVAAFNATANTLPIGTPIQISDITGLSVAENVLGVQGTLNSPGSLNLYRADSSVYWTPVSFSYSTLSNFNTDSANLPFQIPVTVYNGTGLSPFNGLYYVSNLDFTVSGDYDIVVTKLYRNNNWELSANSILKYIANTSLFSTSGTRQGEMWWDFANTDPNTRAAAIFYQSAWVSVNLHPQSGPPSPTLDMGTILFYVGGQLLTDGVAQVTDDYIFTYTSNPLSGEYEFTYLPRTFQGKVYFPHIAISDSITSEYQQDISDLVFSGIQYRMSPNVYDAETLLRLWKAQDLQVVETSAHLAEDNYINPLRADINNGPGPENWERYFVRLPLDYGRNENKWQKTSLICQNFGYWGSTIDPEKMDCPPEESVPAIYEELFLYDQPIPDYTYVYCEPYLYSNIAYSDTTEVGELRNSGIFPASDLQFDEFFEAELIPYEPLHNRQAKLTATIGEGYGDWVGSYVNVNPCVSLTGFYTTDLVEGGISPVQAPVWDASIYKFAPTCESDPQSYSVDANHYKIGYCYFVADASAAEEGFFDPQQEISWRYPSKKTRTGYLVPR
jgi:hypothetical protein